MKNRCGNGLGCIVTCILCRDHGNARGWKKKERSHREDDGAIDWNTLLPWLCRDFENENAGRWSHKERFNLLQQESDKKRFQYCLNPNGFIHHMRAIHGHSGGNKVGPSLQDYVVRTFFTLVLVSTLGTKKIVTRKTVRVLGQNTGSSSPQACPS